jgi:hypothetical protein
MSASSFRVALESVVGTNYEGWNAELWSVVGNVDEESFANCKITNK